MTNVVKLNYTAKEIDERLGSVPNIIQEQQRVSEKVDSLSEMITEHSDLLFQEEKATFLQGWLSFPSGKNNDVTNRCVTETLYITTKDKLAIEPNGMWYEIAIQNAASGEWSLYYPNWIEDGQITSVSFDGDVYIRVGVRTSSNTDITPNDVTANVYIEKFVIDNIKNDIELVEKQIHDISNITNYCAVDTEIVYGRVNSAGVLKEDSTGVLAKFNAIVGKYYRIDLNFSHNRFIVYGYNGIKWIEIGRISTDVLTEYDTYTLFNDQYPVVMVQCWYDASGVVPENISPFIYESDKEDFDDFKICGVSVITPNKLKEIDKDTDTETIGFNCELTSVKNDGDISNDAKNLCLVCQKQIYKNERFPDVSGYLYLDIYENKFYYSSPLPDTPKYLCDWKRDVAYSACGNNTNAKADRWHFSITKDGDIICLLNYKRCKPIVYPSGDYNNPIVVDGITTNPYGLLTQQSIVQMDDGTFYFGEYTLHSLEDEQNNDRRNIWKVTKPYTDASSWTIEHSFKHVYYDSPESDEPDNEIGHIHSVTYDWYTNTLYANTGDIGRHIRIWRKMLPDGVWEECAKCIGDGQSTEDEQRFRTLNLLYTEDACWWASDSKRLCHNLYKAGRDVNGNVDFSTTQKIVNLESFEGRSANNTQPTYINILMRNPNGILFLDRAEDRVDRKLDIVFYSFDENRAYICTTLKKVPESNGLFNMGDKASMINRLGLPNQCAVGYQPFNTDYVMTGGATYIRMNQIDLFNNNPDNYVGAVKIKITR